MSLPHAKREINMPEALRLMMHDLDQPFDWQEHDSTLLMGEESSKLHPHLRAWEPLSANWQCST
jgi:hypothetical protein